MIVRMEYQKIVVTGIVVCIIIVILAYHLLPNDIEVDNNETIIIQDVYLINESNNYSLVFTYYYQSDSSEYLNYSIIFIDQISGEVIARGLGTLYASSNQNATMSVPIEIILTEDWRLIQIENQNVTLKIFMKNFSGKYLVRYQMELKLK